MAGLDIPVGEKPIQNDLNLQPTFALHINTKHFPSCFNIYGIFQECSYYCNSRENCVVHHFETTSLPFIPAMVFELPPQHPGKSAL